MPRIRSLIDIFSSPTYRTDLEKARRTDICVACNRPADTFRNDIFRFEYENSGLCEHCQEQFFFGDEDPAKR